MGAIFAGWAIENAIKLQFPGGNLIGAALTPMVVVAMAGTYLYGRDGHWLYGVIMMLGLCGFIGSSIAMAAYGTPMAKPEPTPKSDQANAC